MRRRELFILLGASAVSFAGGPATAPSPDGSPTKIRGKLTQADGAAPAIELSDGRRINLESDEATRGVLNDKRLAGSDLEAAGHFSNAQQFTVDPIHTKALHVYKNGHRQSISYWCATCSIRTYTPGTCVCCQAETDLDLRDDG